MTIKRRNLLAGTAMALALAACAGQQVPVSQLANYVSLIATSFQGIDTALEQVKGVPTTILTQVGFDITALQKDAAVVARVTSGAQAATVQNVADLVGEIANAVLPLHLGAQGTAVAEVIDAAQTLVPVILAMVKVLGVKSKASGRYTVDTAVARLKQGV